jgi:hypothetical protein
MIGLTSAQIAQAYGAALPYSRPHRFNAEGEERHGNLSSGFKYEFGFINHLSVYVIIDKQHGGRFSHMEALQFMTSAGHAVEWTLLPSSSAAFTPKPAPPSDNSPMDWEYLETDASKKIVRTLFSELQQGRDQLVIYDPQWQPDLAEVAKSRLP